MKTLAAAALALAAVLVGGTAVAQPGAAVAPPADPAAPAEPAAPEPASTGWFGRSGGFVSLGVGVPANISGQLERNDFDGDGEVLSLAVGQRFGMFGLEVGLTRYGIGRPAGTWTNTALAAAGRFTLPVMQKWGAYLRAGIEKTWMSPDGNAADYSGTGWLAGVGAEYKLRVGPVAGSVWAELTRHDATFVSDTREYEGAIDLLSVGVAMNF